MIFDTLHYLALLEQKPNALDQGAPLPDWQLPEEFRQLRRLLEARLSKRGKREFVQVLRLLETFSLAEVTYAVRKAMQLGALSFDAVKHPNGVRAQDPAHVLFATTNAFQPSLASHMIRAIAPVICFHFDSSATSCFLPGGVSR